MESETVAGDSPVCDSESSPGVSPSKTSHVEPGLNPGGPSPKAKYSLTTDSERVARAKDGKNPDKGRTLNLKPHAYKRSEPYVARQGDGVPFA